MYLPALLSSSTSFQLLFSVFKSIFASLSLASSLLPTFFHSLFKTSPLIIFLFSPPLTIVFSHSLRFQCFPFNFLTFPALMFPPPTSSITHRAPQEQLPPLMGFLMTKTCKVWTDSTYNVSFRNNEGSFFLKKIKPLVPSFSLALSSIKAISPL